MPRIRVNGIELYYELHGDPSSAVLVLNNGIIMNASTSWVMQTEVFARHYRILQYDCRGQGLSDHPEGPYTMELHADDLAALLKGLEIGHAHIAGISYGGEVAQAFAIKYPHLIRSLVFADTVSEVGPELRMIIENWIDALNSGDSQYFFNATVPWNFSTEFIVYNDKLLEDAKKRYAMLDFTALITLSQCFLEVNFTHELGRIKAPTCIIVGEKDRLKGLAYARILKREIPHAELHILEGSGHATIWERSAEFNSVVLGFLTKQKEVPITDQK